MATGGRKSQLQVVHEISQAFGAASPASGVLGVLPAGAIAGTAHLAVATAFNSTTNTLALGTTVGGAQILAATDTKTVARTDTAVAIANMGPYAVDTPIYWTLALTGGVPTVGAVVAWLDYLPGVG